MKAIVKLWTGALVETTIGNDGSISVWTDCASFRGNMVFKSGEYKIIKVLR